MRVAGPKHTSSFEFCENGAKAVAWELHQTTIAAGSFSPRTPCAPRARNPITGSRSRAGSPHPMRYNRGTDHYVPFAWEDAFALIGGMLRALASPDAAAFYTSGRTSNEAAFLYQLFVREFGTNNLPDCSNLCHEATSVGLPSFIGVGKGTVTLADFEHPTRSSPSATTRAPTIRACSRRCRRSRRGVPIVVFNPMRERGLERFPPPQHAAEMLTAATRLPPIISSRVGSDFGCSRA